MDAGGICVARSLPIDGALLRDVLIRLRRDIPGGVARWTLGGRGAAEFDVDFFPILTDTGDPIPAWSSTARLWDPDGVAMLPAVVELRSATIDSCELSLRPVSPPAPWCRPAFSTVHDHRSLGLLRSLTLSALSLVAPSLEYSIKKRSSSVVPA